MQNSHIEDNILIQHNAAVVLDNFISLSDKGFPRLQWLVGKIIGVISTIWLLARD